MASATVVQDMLTLLEPLINELDPEDIFTPSHRDYDLHTAPFSTHKHLRPAVVIAPSQTESLAKVLSYLYTSGLNFDIRGQGFGSTSARDVLISLIKFKSFEYDHVKKVATLGTGSTWVEVAKNMKEADPQYTVTMARTPSVGVGGSILHGGYSWLSSEFGFISDPLNFVNAEVVKYDGTIVMAADEPDLMWALRGCGGGFGVMTKVILRAFPYPTDIWSGMILIPRNNLPKLARDIVDFISTPQDPKLNFLLYIVRQHILPTILTEDQLQSVEGDMLALHVYDGRGESHGREKFKWALKLPGVIDKTVVTDMKGITDMQQNVSMLRGMMTNIHAVPMAVADLDEETITRAVEWHDQIGDIDQEIQNISMMVIEFLVLGPLIGSLNDLGWPRPLDAKHYLLFLTGCPAGGTAEQEEKARQLVFNSPESILGKDRKYTVLPAGLDELQDPKKVYGPHWDKLVQLRNRYDPRHKFQAFINP